jgi:hypothetical protein
MKEHLSDPHGAHSQNIILDTKKENSQEARKRGILRKTWK